MTQGPPNDCDAELIAYFAGRLERLARLKVALPRAAWEERPSVRLIHAAIRSTVVDLARLGQADLAAAVMARARPSRSGSSADAIRRLLAPRDGSDGAASRSAS